MSRPSDDDRGASRISRIRDNPFYVLGVRPHASRATIEREGQKLLGMLEIGLASASTYKTPVGPVERTADKVRGALAELRDPERRLVHEVWAALDPDRSAMPEASGESRAQPWSEAFAALGWGRR